MNLKNIDWTFDCGVWSASVMGLQLAVVQDADGTYMATCSGGSARPEIQKGFGTPQDARFYAQDTMLRREYQKYFATPEWTEDDVLDGIAEWFSRAVPTPALRNQMVQAGCLFEEAAELAEALGAGCPQIGDLADELKQGVSKFDPRARSDAGCPVRPHRDLRRACLHDGVRPARGVGGGKRLQLEQV